MMSNDILSSLNKIFSEYKKEIHKGIFFNLQNAKSPLDIFGVLEVMKYKLQKWQNTNIFYFIP